MGAEGSADSATVAAGLGVTGQVEEAVITGQVAPVVVCSVGLGAAAGSVVAGLAALDWGAVEKAELGLAVAEKAAVGSGVVALEVAAMVRISLSSRMHTKSAKGYRCSCSIRVARPTMKFHTDCRCMR